MVTHFQVAGHHWFVVVFHVTVFHVLSVRAQPWPVEPWKGSQHSLAAGGRVAAKVDADNVPLEEGRLNEVNEILAAGSALPQEEEAGP